MEEKSRNRLAVLIAVILTLSVAYSFAINLFGDTPSVGLATGTGGEEPGNPGSSLSGEIRVDVTPATVQSVVASLARYRSYSRVIQIQYLSGEEVSGTLSASVYVDGGWTRVDLTTPAHVEHTIVADGVCYRWYNSETEYVTFEAEEGLADLAQRLPTYEDVLELDPARITAAGYENRNGVACIYVETSVDALNYCERYWISVESGLLVAAETLKGNGDLVYSMTGYAVESPLTDAEEYFDLPGGVEQPEEE